MRSLLNLLSVSRTTERSVNVTVENVKLLSFFSNRFCLDPDLRLEKVAALCPANLTGADFYALCSDAMLQSVKRKIEILEQGMIIIIVSRIVNSRSYLSQISMCDHLV